MSQELYLEYGFRSGKNQAKRKPHALSQNHVAIVRKSLKTPLMHTKQPKVFSTGFPRGAVVDPLDGRSWLWRHIGV
jgi:hypothetical protein